MSIPDERVIQQVEKLRRRHGSCTLEDLAAACHMSKTAMRYRVERLCASGVLTRSDRAGSLRVRPRPIESEMRLRVRYDPRVEQVLDVRVMPAD